jgi:hypothetical protein
MSEKEFQVGEEIEAMCGTCKAATVHNIEVIKEGEPTKVLCKSCNKSHKYRKPPADGEPEKPKRKKTAKPKAPPKSKEQRKWSRVMRKVEGTDPVPYNMGEAFEEQNVIDHSKFGVGVVSDVIDPTKISVVFEHGEKVLVHNRD